MILLTPDEWPIVAHVIAETIPFVNVTMGFQRQSSGEIWVNRRDNPSSVLAIFGRDAFVSGNVDEPGIRKLLAGFSGTIADAPGLKAVLSDVWSNVIHIPSIIYRHSKMPDRPHVPTGFRLLKMSPANVALVGSLWPDDVKRETIGYFDDYTDFFRSGYGYMIVDERSGQCVSVCATIAVSQQRADHGIDTAYAYEGMGLGTACAVATVREGVRRGMRPIWIAAVGNAPSHRVATKIGFVPDKQRLLFERLASWNVQLDGPARFL